MKRQYVPEVFYRDYQKITVSVIGAGGTGSLLLRQLIRINLALIGLGMKGLHVRCFDFDTVSESNIGRQDFFRKEDIGLNKADVIISKINIHHGFEWEAYPNKIGKEEKYVFSNITFICVDNAKARKNIYGLAGTLNLYGNHEFNPFYIIDCGNDFKTGQVYLSTIQKISQPKSKHETVEFIKNPIEKYGYDIYGKEEDNTPSCSIAQALGKQDLMINNFVANVAAKIFWNILRDKFIYYNISYINLEKLSIRTNRL